MLNVLRSGYLRTILFLIAGMLMIPAVRTSGADAEAPLPENFGGGVEESRVLDDVKGEARVEPLSGDAKVKLSGKIRKLRVGALNGAAVLDASELVAGEIVVEGAINGGAVAKLNAPGGKVTLTGEVAGGTRVEIAAPEGVVVLGSDENTPIGGGTNLRIVAREVVVRGPAGGGSHVSITFTREGKLKFDRLSEGAQISYSKSAAGDPAVVVDAGQITGGAGAREAGGQAVEGNHDAPAVVTVQVRPNLFIDPGPAIPAGILPVTGDAIAAQIVSMEDDKVTFRRSGVGGEPESMEMNKIAAVLFSPIPIAKQEVLAREGAGVLLRTGDFVDGAPKSLDGNQVTVSSIVFGLRKFDTKRDAVALVLRAKTKN